jgi:hypothetical protein
MIDLFIEFVALVAHGNPLRRAGHRRRVISEESQRPPVQDPQGYRRRPVTLTAGRRSRLLHGVQTDCVTLGIGHGSDVAVLTDRELIFHDRASILGDARALNSAILACEIDNDASHAGRTIVHLHERARSAGVIRFAGKGPHFGDTGSRVAQLFQLLAEHTLI